MSSELSEEVSNIQLENDEDLEKKSDGDKGQKITIQLILDRSNLTPDKTESLLKLTHIRLDRARIDEIDNLAEYLNHTRLTHLYLHCNRITRIENLEFLDNLTCLNLASNRITRVENLKHLKRLQMLDLSSNLIDSAANEIACELPPNVAFLDLRENPVFNDVRRKESNFDYLIANCSSLIQLNGVDLVEEDEEESDRKFSNSSGKVDNVDSDLVAQLKDSILERSRVRHLNDKIQMERAWEQKKLKLDSIKTSVNEKFKIRK